MNFSNALPSSVVPPPPSYALSSQQEAIMEWVRSGSGNAVIEAVAGAGKTSTLVAALGYMTGSVAMTCFNKKIADEIKSKTAHYSNVTVSTFHAFGFAAWRKYVAARGGGKVEVDDRKKSDQMMDFLKVPWEMRKAVRALVSLAKQSGAGVTWDTVQELDGAAVPTDTWAALIDHFDVLLEADQSSEPDDVLAAMLTKFAIDGISWSAAAGATIIDFDDMIWLPLLNDAHIDQYDWVLVDEAQDTNDMRRVFASRMRKLAGRLIAVGDRHQAIYGFTGADSDALNRIIEQFSCITLPLHTTYRCSKSATAVAQRYVPHIEAHENNKVGSVRRLYEDEFIDLCINDVGNNPPIPAPAAGDVILCRNTKPLVSLAMKMIRHGIGCHVEGRDIGKKIAGLLRKWKSAKTVEDLIERLMAYKNRETEKFIAQGAEYRIESLADRVDTAIMLTEDCATIREVEEKIQRMFEDVDESGSRRTITLSTIHKAKGREWERVYILGFDRYLPSKYAKQDWEKQSEQNLAYVGVTRAKVDLVLTVMGTG